MSVALPEATGGAAHRLKPSAARLDELLLQEATTLGDLFRISLDLIQEGASDEVSVFASAADPRRRAG